MPQSNYKTLQLFLLKLLFYSFFHLNFYRVWSEQPAHPSLVSSFNINVNWTQSTSISIRYITLLYSIREHRVSCLKAHTSTQQTELTLPLTVKTNKKTRLAEHCALKHLDFPRLQFDLRQLVLIPRLSCRESCIILAQVWIIPPSHIGSINFGLHCWSLLCFL